MATEKKTAAKPAKAEKVKSTEKPAAKAAAPSAAAPVAKASGRVNDHLGLDHRKIATGVVVSDKMQKTIVVKIDRRIRHTLYKKYVTKSQRFKAHDEKNDAKVGDLVIIVESRPLSRDKRWALQKIVRRAEVTAEANV